MTRIRGRFKCSIGVVVVVVLLLVSVSASASASAAAAWWQITATTAPSNLPPGGEGEIVVQVTNLGDAPVEVAGRPVTLGVKLPVGLTATGIHSQFAGPSNNREEFGCSLPALTCTYEGETANPNGGGDDHGSVQPYDGLDVVVDVKLGAGVVSGSEYEVAVSGGSAPGVSLKRPVVVSGGGTSFGVADYEVYPANEDGLPDTQAGSHPFQLTATLMLNTVIESGYNYFDQEFVPEAAPVALMKDLHFELPPGLIGNPTPLPQCTEKQFTTAGEFANECPADTAVGVATVVTTNLIQPFALPQVLTVPVFNLVPSVGEPARFGFTPGIPVVLDTSVRTGGDYGVVVSISNTTQVVAFVGSQVTFWGVPGDPRHDSSRGWACLWGSEGEVGSNGPACNPEGDEHPVPFLVLPTACTDLLQSTVHADSWVAPGTLASREYTFADLMGEPYGLDGCNRLGFEPVISATPDGQAGSAPTGLTTTIHVPQTAGLSPSGDAQAAVKDTTVTLPEGVALNPSAADGLSSCGESEVGLEDALEATCPEFSKVGTVEIRTPLLPHPLVGAAYLATQDSNPFGALIALYIVARDPLSGVLVKLAGQVTPNPVTGQLVTTFKETPEVPFEDFSLHFFGGSRAPLSTPPLCGAYTTTASFVPWSGNAPVESSSTFDIASGPNNTPCANPRPFQPGFEAGTTSVQAGGYSPLTLTMDRPDADQPLGKLSVVFPPGVSAGLEGVKLCEEPQAAEGKCPAESQIGQVTASAGLGGNPFPVETGKAYITGRYEGDPFGVEIVVPAIAGPFNLGTEIVRAKVDVDPTDAHLTVVSDPFPTILDGIPLELQHVNVTVNRPGFVFNPTSCEPMKLTGELESSEGAKADVSTPFQVTNCAALAFKPEFKVSTGAHTSRVDGATLHVDLTLPNAPRGTQANVAKVKVSLPKQLPSPLKTLQKACTEKVFAENPSSCPVASRVGEAHVSTPVLEGGLSGPAYFVSHGGAKYPELIMVLTGEDGVTVQVHGETFISKKGITSATFNTVPDVPFSGFELTLPQREDPAVTANGNLCKGTLLMPTEFVGQNGVRITQSTKIAVSGCSKVKRASHKEASHKRKGKGAHGRGKRARKG